VSFALPAQAARKHTASADVQASCKAQAAKKFSAIHFLKRKNFVNQCVAQHNGGKVVAKSKAKANERMAQPTNAQPMSTGAKPSTTGQAPKQ